MKVKHEMKKYMKKGIIPFSAQIEKKINEKGEYKKEVKFASFFDESISKWCGWEHSTLEKPLYNEGWNSIALKTGKICGIFVLDIDNVEDWQKILKDNEREEPNTVTVISGSGGIHYYFKYEDHLDIIPNRTRIIGETIDARTNGGCIFCPPSKYFNNETQKEVSYEWKKGKSLFEIDPTPCPKWIFKMMLETVEKEEKNENEKVTKTKKSKISKTKIADAEEIIFEKELINLPTDQMDELLNMLKKERYENYSDWVKVLFALKCENDDKYFDCFLSFSSKWEKYDKNTTMNTWNKYKSKKKNLLTYNSVLYWAHQDNEEEYVKFMDKYFNTKDDIKIEGKKELIIEKDYLLDNQKIGDCEVSKFITDYLDDEEIKVLDIFSPYNTGKTSLLREIAKNKKIQKILIVSYRITLSDNLMGDFGKIGFKKYTETYEANKLICQIDSLENITDYDDYDLVIIDEIESALNHFSSSTIKNQKRLFEVLVEICECAKKIINLDGDLGPRTKIFSDLFGDSYLLKNTIKKDKKHFIFHCDQNKYDKLIDEDLKNGKNICIVSMSSKEAKNYYEMYKNTQKAILYTSTTNDKDKKLLCEVNKIWKEFNLIVYSPCIEAGVNFDIPHVDKIYVFLSAQSTSQRGLKQMINRIRKVNDININVFVNNIQPNERSVRMHYTFNDVLRFYTEIMGREKITEMVKGRRVIKNTFDSFDTIEMLNKVERLNSNSNCFLPIFINIIKCDHTFEFFDKTKTVKRAKKDQLFFNEIVEAKRIDDQTYQELLKKQAMQDLTEIEKIQIKKHVYEFGFKIQIDDIDTLKKVYNKIDSLKQYKNLIKGTNNDINKSPKQLKEINEKIKIVENILTTLGVDKKKMLGFDHIIQTETLEKNMVQIVTMLSENKILFGLSNSYQVKSMKAFLGSLNTIIDNYGLEIKPKKKTERDENKKVIKVKEGYVLKITDEIKNVNKINFDL